MKEPIFKWDADTGTAYCAIWDADGHMHEGTAVCHADDADMMSEKTGLDIARRRAELSAYKAFKYKLEIEYDGVKFKGFIDKVVKNDDGTYSIVDYKTSTPVKSSAIAPNEKH